MGGVRLGVDVGGTNTDAVLVDDRSLVAWLKTPTTSDVESGVFNAIETILQDAHLEADKIGSVTIGTTQFTNAFVERRRLTPIGIVRLGAPYSTCVPPLYDWPKELTEVVGRDAAIIRGGYEFDGREISPLDEQELREIARGFREKGLNSVGVSCIFSPVNAAMERRAEQIIREEIPEVRVSLSSAFGRMGLIERENATAMNACLVNLATIVVGSFRRALHRLHVTAPLYLSQNDGTLMTAEQVERHPVLTFASGPTNSMRGAAFLSGLDDAVVVDIGGTTSDVGCLVRSLPRESAVAVDIGGVRTNFRMPDIVSIGLGGGSIVDDRKPVKIGPQSVGYALTQNARVFGGDTLTATDIAVAAGQADIGNRAALADLDPELVRGALAEIKAKLEDAIDRIKTNRADVPLVLVGGGSILVSGKLKGISEVHVPKNSAVANAVGAAIAQVGGEVDSYFDYRLQGRDVVLAKAKQDACNRAIEAGAEPATLRIVEVDEMPLAYLPGQTVRVRVKAIGDLVTQTAAGVKSGERPQGAIG